MSHINTVAVSGNLTADPEKKVVGDDFTIVNLRLANNRQKKVDGEYEEVASFFSVTVFGKFGDLCDRKLRKGDLISVAGRLEEQRWEQDGQNRSKVVIIANEIDSKAFFQKDDEVKAKENGDTPASSAAAPAAGAATDDDIPF